MEPRRDVSREDFQRILVAIMAELGLSVKDVACRADVSQPVVRRWISGAGTPHPVFRFRILRWIFTEGE